MQRSILDLIHNGDIQQVTNLIERGEKLDIEKHTDAVKAMVAKNIDAEKLLAFIDMLLQKGCPDEHIILFTLPFEFKSFANKNLKEHIYQIIAANPDSASKILACKRALNPCDPLGHIIQLYRPHREYGAHKGIIKEFQHLLASTKGASGFDTKGTELNVITTSSSAPASEETIDLLIDAEAFTFTVIPSPELPEQFAGVKKSSQHEMERSIKVKKYLERKTVAALAEPLAEECELVRLVKIFSGDMGDVNREAIDTVIAMLAQGVKFDLVRYSPFVKTMVARNPFPGLFLRLIETLQQAGCTDADIIEYALPNNVQAYSIKDWSMRLINHMEIIVKDPAEIIKFCDQAMDAQHPIGFLMKQLRQPNINPLIRKMRDTKIAALQTTVVKNNNNAEQQSEPNILEPIPRAASGLPEQLSGSGEVEYPNNGIEEIFFDVEDLFLILHRMFEDKSLDCEVEIAEFVKRNERLRRGPELSVCTNNPLYLAVLRGSVSLVRNLTQLIENSKDAQAYAAQNSSSEIFDASLRNFINVFIFKAVLERMHKLTKANTPIENLAEEILKFLFILTSRVDMRYINRTISKQFGSYLSTEMKRALIVKLLEMIRDGKTGFTLENMKDPQHTLCHVLNFDEASRFRFAKNTFVQLLDEVEQEFASSNVLQRK